MQVFRGVRVHSHKNLARSSLQVAPPTLVLGRSAGGGGNVNPEKVSEGASPPSRCYSPPPWLTWHNRDTLCHGTQ
jgi:hypothetical protein